MCVPLLCASVNVTFPRTEWWGQAEHSNYHVYPVLPRMQCVQRGLRCWWGVWYGQQRWKHPQLWLNTEGQVSHTCCFDWLLLSREDVVITVERGVWVYVTSSSSPGRSSSRTTVRGRMWSSFPAALALKMTTEQMASQTWGPHFPLGRWSGLKHTLFPSRHLFSVCSCLVALEFIVFSYTELTQI